MKHITSLQVKKNDGTFTSYPLGLIERVTGAHPDSLEVSGWETGTGQPPYYINVVAPNYNKKRLTVIYFDTNDDSVKSEILTCGITVTGIGTDQIRFQALKKPTVKITPIILLGDVVDEEIQPVLVPPDGISKKTVVDALGYTPAGGENLVLDSGEIKNSDIYNYTLSEKIKLNQNYTVTIWGELPNNESMFYIYIGHANSSRFSILEKKGDGLYIGYGEFKNWYDDNQKLNSNKFFVYAFKDDDRVNSTIHRIKLEPGTVPDPVWTPAPEDVLLKGEVDRRNLALDSRNEKTFNASASGTSLGPILNLSGTALDLKNGDILTISYEAKTTVNGTTLLADLRNPNYPVSVYDGKQLKTLTTEYKRYIWTSAITDTPDRVVFISQLQSNNPGTISIRNVKVELGINPNPQWTPAPEDTVTYVKDNHILVIGTNN